MRLYERATSNWLYILDTRVSAVLMYAFAFGKA